MAKKKGAKKKAAKRAPAKKAARRGAPRKPARNAKRKAAAAAPANKATPYLCVKGGAAALDFYRNAFAAVETMRLAGKDGSIGHAQVEIEGAAIMISDEWPEGGVFSPHTLGGSPVSIHLYVRDVDDFVRRALARGATELRAVADQPYGDRSGTIRDPFGHRWMVSTKKEDVSKEEMERRFGGAYLVT